MQGEPMVFIMSTNRLKVLMKNIRGWVNLLEDVLIDIEADRRAQMFPGTWKCTVDRDNLTGDIKLTFKPSLNGNVSGTIDHTFYSVNLKSRTT